MCMDRYNQDSSYIHERIDGTSHARDHKGVKEFIHDLLCVNNVHYLTFALWTDLKSITPSIVLFITERISSHYEYILL